MTPAAIVMLKRVKRLILAEPKRMMMKAVAAHIDRFIEKYR